MTTHSAKSRGSKRLIAAVVLAVSAGLAGCGGDGGFDGIEVNSKLLDAVGLSGNPFKKDEPKTLTRAPLVLPPDNTRLPEPGAAPQAAPVTLAADPAWPRDPDQIRLADADAKKKADAERCNGNGNWKERATKDELALANQNCGLLNGMIGNALNNDKK